MSALVFGNPWHGRYSAAGLTLANSTLHPEWLPSPDRPCNTDYVNFGMPAAPAMLPSETALGMVWENDMVLSGGNKRWCPAGMAINSNGWLYKATDGTVFRLSVSINYSTRMLYVSARKFAESDTVIFSVSLALESTSSADYYELNQSPMGDRCILSVGKELTATDYYGATYQYTEKFEFFSEITLSGGSVSSLPTVTNTVLYTYLTVSTVPPAWNVAPPRNVLNPVRDVYAESVGYSSSTGIVLIGYDKAGVRKEVSTLSTNWVLSTSAGGSTPPSPGTTTNNAYHSTWQASVLVNGVSVFDFPLAEKHQVAHTDYVVEGSIIVGHTTITVDTETNWEYAGVNIQARILSNVLSALGVSLFAASATVECACTPYGIVSGATLNGMQFEPGYSNSLDVAAYNPRNGEVAVGVKAGFI